MSKRFQMLCLLALLIVLLGLLLAGSFSSCSLGPKSLITREQAIVLIAYNAVPYMDSYLHQMEQPLLKYPVSASGDWAAEWKDGVWTVSCQVTVQYPSGPKTGNSTWTLSEVDSTIKLVKLVWD